MNKYLCVIVMLCMVSILTACNNKVDEQVANINNKPEVQTALDNEQIELEVWSFFNDGWEEVFSNFQKSFPNVSFNLSVFNYHEYTNKYLEALQLNNAPDIMIIDSHHFGEFNSLGVLEDFFQESYSFMNYTNDFPPALLRAGKSFDRTKLLGIPFNTSPMVTYYRADLMEKYGFPSEPNELGHFIEDPNHWLEIAEALKKDNRYIVQWSLDIINIFETGFPIYDEDLNFLRDDDIFYEAIEFTKEAHQKGFFGYFDIWGERGQRALKEDEIAMVYLGSWGAEQIKAWVPEQAGKWRATKLPFNVNGWSNTTFFSVPKQSNQKEVAWKFIEFYTFENSMNGIYGSVPAYIPARKNTDLMEKENIFLGGQKDQELYELLMEEAKEHPISPIDQQTKGIWFNAVNLGVEWELPKEIIIDNAMKELDLQLEVKKQILLSSKD